MLMRKNIISLVVVGFFSALIGWFVSAVLIPTEIEKVQYKRIQVDIPTEVSPLDKAYFNEKSIDTFRKTQIGTDPDD